MTSKRTHENLFLYSANQEDGFMHLLINPFNAYVQNTWPVDDCHSALGVATWSCAAVVKSLLFIVRHGAPAGIQYIFLDICTPYNV